MILDIKKQLGLRIKNLRQEYGYTQEQFAKKFGIAPRTLCYIEKGKNFLTAATMEKILAVLDLSLDELFFVSPNLPSDELKTEICAIINKIQKRDKLENVYKIIKSVVN